MKIGPNKKKKRKKRKKRSRGSLDRIFAAGHPSSSLLQPRPTQLNFNGANITELREGLRDTHS